MNQRGTTWVVFDLNYGSKPLQSIIISFVVSNSFFKLSQRFVPCISLLVIIDNVLIATRPFLTFFFNLQIIGY